MLLYLALFLTLPFSVLLILFGSVGAGAIAATWFAAEQERARQRRVVKLVIQPDTERDLVEKVG
jgi:hypothetical protein